MHGGLCIPSLLTCVPALLSAGCLFYCPLPVCHPAHLVGERSHPGRCSGWHWILHWETVQHHQVDGGRGERWCQVRKHDTFLWLYGLGIYRTIYFFYPAKCFFSSCPEFCIESWFLAFQLSQLYESFKSCSSYSVCSLPATLDGSKFYHIAFEQFSRGKVSPQQSLLRWPLVWDQALLLHGALLLWL